MARMETKVHQAADNFKNKDFLFDVIRRCQDGDMEAMETVYTGYKSSIFNVAYRFSGSRASAEDLMQEIFIKVFTQINKLRSLEAFNSWFYRIATHTCISFTRKRGRLSEIPNEKIEETPSPNNDMTAIKQDLEQAINILPPKQKMVFILHDVQGFTHMEIAKIMKLRQGTCKSQLFKARMKLREYLME